MKFKREIIAIILIICMLFTISAISAADSSTDAVGVTNESVKAVNEDLANDNLAMKNDVEILGEGESSDVGNFDDLNTAINGDTTSNIVYLNKDYLFDSSTDGSYTSGIRITRSLTIDGNGHIIDADGKACIIEALSTITLKNITFKNAYSTSSGGAVYFEGNDNSIINCNFINNQAVDGGAIYSYAYYRMGSIINSTFINNKATEGSAVLYNYADTGTIDGCIFINNIGTSTIINAPYCPLIVKNSIFIGNSANNIISASNPNINNNWWGSTYDNYQNPPNVGSSITTNKYYVLNMILDDSGSVTVSLNNLCQDGVVAPDGDYALPSIKLDVVGKGVEVTDYIVLGSDGIATIEYTPADAYAITVSYNGVELTREVKPTFKLLNDKINAEGSKITLEQDYIYDSAKDSSLTNGIEFVKDMTIDGQGHIIDAKESSNIFYFNDETNTYSLTLKDIIFANATGTNGAAVYFKGKKLEIINCTFINNAANSQGDAIYVADATSSENKIIESRFINNTGSNSVVYVNLDSSNSKLNLNNSIFARNVATYNVKGTSNVNVDYNWWGNTAENYAINSPNVDGVTLNNWLFLKIDANAAITDDATISLNNLYDGSDVSTYSEYLLPSTTLNLGGSGVRNGVNIITLENGEATYEVTMLRTTASITASYEDITTTKELEYTIVDDGSFKALNDILWFAEDDIELTKNYTFIEGVDTITDGMSIIRGITINGNGYTIDAKGKAAILIVRAHNVQLKNINFVNGVANYGGAVGTSAYYLSIDNCTFINNTANEDGGAVFSQSYEPITVTNSKFINNTANEDGGAIFTYAYYSPFAVVDGCIFINNTALYSSVIYAYMCNVQNSIFLNNPGNMIRGYYATSHIIQNNWFGNTFDNRTTKPRMESPISSWLYLDIKFYEEFAIVSLNNVYSSSSGSSSVYTNYNLPEITLNINSTNLNLNTNKVTLDSTGKAIVPYTKIADDAALTVSYNDVSLTKDCVVGEFDLLQELIDKTAGDTIELDRNYSFIEGVDTLTNGISITSDITIDGKGHTINGSNLARILYITTNGVTLKNINFADGYATQGGAIFNNVGSGFKLINCTFENNVAYDNPGGAIYTYSNGVNDFINCTFIANKITKVYQYGGAVYIYENSGQNNFIGCTFINNTAHYGGAIATGNGKAITNVDKSVFIANTANFYSSIYIRGGSTAEFYLKNSIIFSKGLTTDSSTQVYAANTLRASDVNYNWWMHTSDIKTQNVYVRCSGGGLSVTKYLFIDMDCENEVATISLNNVYDTSGTTSTYDGELPQITFALSGTNLVSDDTATLNKNGIAEVAYDIAAQTGSLTATYNSVSITKTVTSDDSFTTLQGKISRALEGSEVVLYHDYNYDDAKDSALTEGIVIDKDLTIDGQGYTIDAKEATRIFNINENTNNIVLKNINFVNAVGDDGAAVFANCNNLEIINCTFENNKATGNGDAIYLIANSCDITESTFVNNVGSVSTIYLDSELDDVKFNIDNSILVNNAGTDVVKAKGTLTADYNWWGNTVDNNDDLSGGLAQKWYVLDMAVDDTKAIASISLNHLNDGTTSENYALPSITLNTQATNGGVRKDKITLDENGDATVGYIATGGDASLTAEYNGVSITREITYDADSDYSFKALKKLIDAAQDNDVIDLAHDYEYVIGYDDITEGIYITQNNLTINGNGFTINAKERTRIFYVGVADTITALGVIIKNTTFENGKISGTYGGSAIRWYGMNGTLINCTFENNSAAGNGGAVYWYGSYANVTDCTFKANVVTASARGGAICIQSKNAIVFNSTFIENKASNGGGSIYIFQDNVVVNKSVFVRSDGSAIFVSANNATIINSTFAENIAGNGGAINWDSGNKGTIINSTFTNNIANTNGGAIYWNVKLDIINSTFINNNAKNYGGAIYCNNIGGTIYNATFKNNTAINGGGIYTRSGTLSINDTVFMNNSAQSTSAAAYGGAIYDFTSDKVTLVNSSFIGNFVKTRSSGAYGGAIYTAYGEIDIANSTFNKNSIDSNSGTTYGSVIYWYNGATGKITNSSFINNHGKSSSGAAIYITSTNSKANVTNSIFINNTYGTSNVLRVLQRYSGTIEFNDCWFGNTKLNSGELMGTDIGTGITYNNKLILYAVHDEFMVVGDDREIKFVLQYVENGMNKIYDSSKLPKVDFALSSVNGDLDKSSASMDETILFNANQFGSASITAKYNGIELTEELKAKDKPTITVKEPVVVHVGETLSINFVELIPQDANPVFSGIEGDEFIFVLNNGYVDGLKEGTSTLYINYGGNDDYTPLTVEVPVTVIKYTTSINSDVDSISADWGADSQSVTIGFDNGNPNFDPESLDEYDVFSLKFKSNDTKVATVSIVEGKPQINFRSAGTANVTFYFEGNEKYYASEKNITVTVKKVASSVSFSNDVEFDFEGSGTTTLTLTGTNGVSVSVEEHPEAVAEFNSETNATTVSGLNAGSYTLVVTTDPDENHTSVTETAAITVNKIDSSVDLDGNLDFDYGDHGSISLINLIGCDVQVDGISVEGHPEAIIGFENNVISVSGIDAGDYTLKVTTTPDGNHKSVDVHHEFTVNTIDSSLILGDIEFDYLSAGSTTITDFIGCTVDIENITVEGHPEAVIGFENDEITVSNLGAGTYTLNVVTTPDSNHKSVSVSKNIKVNPIPSKITLNSTEIVYKYDESSSVKLTLVGCSVDLENITVDENNVAGVTYDAETNVITISGVDFGTHTLKVITTPDENHTSVSATANINVEKSDSSVEFSNPISLFYSEEGSTTLTLNGCSVDLENITVVDHPEANIRYENNIITVSGLEQGKYTLKVITTPDSNHLSVVETISVSVDKQSPKLTMEYSNITVGEKELVYVSMEAAGDVNITIYKGNSVVRSENVTIGDSGFNKITFTDLKVGTYDITAYYKGQTRFNDSTLKYKLVIRPIYEYEFSAAVNSTVMGNKTNATVNLPAGASGKIVIGDIERDVEGTKTVIELPEQTTLGKNNVTVKYVPDEDSKYAGREVTIVYDISKVITEIELTVVNKTTADPVIITAAIGAEGNVTFIINGKKYSRQINENTATLEINDVAGGKYNLTAVYEGSEKYTNSSANVTYTVEKINSTISIDLTPETIKTDESATVTVSVDGSGIVTFTVNGVENNVTVDGGVATLTLDKLAKGTTAISAKYLGDDKYNPNETHEITLTVNPVTDYVFTLEIANITVGENAIAYVFLPGDATNKTNITVKQGDEIVFSENTTLKLTIPDLSVGTYNITAKYYGDEKYDEKSIIKEFTVNPLNIGKLNFTVNVNNTVFGNTTNITVTLSDDASGSIVIGDIVEAVEGKVTVIELPAQITAGINNVTVRYVPDANSKYGEESVTAFYNVAKKIAVITIDPIDKKAGDMVEINAHAYEGAVIVVSIDGIATNTSENISAGKHTVVATVDETPEYLAASANYTFEVTKSNVGMFNVIGSSTKVGGNSTIIVAFTEEDVTGIVVVNVNGTEYSLNISDRESQFEVVMPTVGNATLSARYLGNYKYDAKDAQPKLIEVTEKDNVTGIVLPDLSDVKVGSDSNITVPSGVDVYVDGVKQTPKDGNVSVPSDAGNHTIIIVAEETPDTKAVFEVFNYEVTKNDVEISVSGTSAKVNEKSTITVNITDGATGIVVINVNGTEYSLDISVNKTLEVVMPNVGNATLSARYLGDDKYNPRDIEASPIEVTDKKQRNDYKVPDLSDVKVDDKLNIAVPSDVDVYVDGVKQTPKDGNVSVLSTAGNHTIIIVADETNDTKAVFEVFNYEVTKNDVEISVSGTSAKVNEKSTITVDITDGATGIVVINVNGTEYSLNIPENNTLEIVMSNIGDVSLSARYMGDDKYNAKDAESTTIKVEDKFDSIIEIQDPELIVGSEVIPISATVNGADADIIYTINGKETYVIDKVRAITYTITATFEGNSTHKANTTSIVITVDKKQSTLEIMPSEIRIGEPVIFEINPGERSDVVVYIDGVNYEYDVNQQNVEFTDTTAGTHTIVASLSETDEYLSAAANYTFTIDKKDSIIEITSSADSIYTGEKITVTANIKEGNAGIVLVNVNGTLYSLNAGDNELSVVLDKAGSYTINATYMGDDVFKSSNSNVETVEVSEKSLSPVSIEIPDMNNVGEDIVINITSQADPEVYVDGKKQSYKDGKVIISDLEAGNHIIEVIVPETATSKANSTSALFNVDKKDSSIEIATSDDSVYVGSTITVYFNTIQDADGTVLVNVNGTVYSLPVSDAKLDVVLDKVGSYTINATYNGNEAFKSNNSNVLTVEVRQKEASAIDVQIPDASKVGEDIVINVTAQATPEVYVDGKKQTYKDGKVTVSGLDAGKHVIEVIVPETETSKANSTVKTFEVSKKESSINIIGIDGDKFVDSNLKVNLEYEGNSIAVYLDGEILTDYNLFKASAGNHTITASVIGDDEYLSSGANVTFEILKKDADIYVSGTYTTVGEKSTITVDIDEAATGIVVVNVNGTEYSLNLSKTTTLDVVFNEAGEYDISAIYLGDEKYNTAKAGDTILIFDKKLADIEITIPVDIINAGSNVNVFVDYVGDGELTLTVDGVIQDLNGGQFLIENVKAGIHTIEVTSSETKDYKEFTAIEIFEAFKKSSEVSITVPSDIKPGDDVEIEISSYEDAYITVTLDGAKQTLTDGKLIFRPAAGNHTIRASVDETDIYLANSSEKTFTVSRLDSAIEVTATDITQGQSTEITVSTDLNEGIVVVKLNGTEVAIDLAKSKSASVVLDAPGVYELSARYLGSDIYNEAEAAKSTIKVSEKATPEVDVSVPEIKAGESETISVSVPNATGNVHVIVDGVEEIIPLDENGRANYTVPEMSAGSHSIVVVYPGDDTHEAKVVTQKVDVSKQSSKADITAPTDVKEGENATVSVDIPGATGNVSVIIDGKEITVPLDENGKANYTIPEMTAGDHSVVVIYPGDDTHDATHSAASFSVEGEVIIPKLTTEFANINLTGDLTIQAVLKDSQANPVAGALISYSVGGQAGTVITAADGSFEIKGKNNAVVTLEYAGDDSLEPTNISIKIDDVVSPVSRLGSKLNVSEGVSIKTYAVDAPAGEVGSLAKFVLTDSNDRPIANATIKFAYKTVILNRTTDENGVVFIGINTQLAQEALCALSYVGDENYNATFVAFSFDIQKKPIKISAPAKTFKSSLKTKKYTVTLKTDVCNSNDGKVYLSAGKKVTMKISGKTYTGKINDKGQVTFNLKISKKGKYSATIKFAGDKTYASASKTVKITIK